MYSRLDFIEDLKKELSKDFNIKKLSRWALITRLDKRYSDPEIDKMIFIIMAMEEGDEFVLTKEELLQLVEKLEK